MDRLTGENAPSVYVHSRKIGNSTMHLIINTDAERRVAAEVRLPDMGFDTALLDLYGGNLYGIETDRGAFDVYLSPAGSVCVICGEEAGKAEEPAPVMLGSGASLKDFSGCQPVSLINGYECRIPDENVLLVDTFRLSMDGRQVYQGPVCGAWHTHFYPAPEGTRFEAIYEFHSDCKIKGCFAVIQVAENLDRMAFNGEPIKASKVRGETGALDANKCWKDGSFTKVQLPELRQGLNTLIIQGRKCNNITGSGRHARVSDWKEHQPTEAGEVYVCGRFCVTALATGLYGITSFREPAGRNITYEGFPFYCGRVLYKASFELHDDYAGKAYLQLHNANMACAEVRVNGQPCGTIRWKPATVDISGAAKPGLNTMEVEAVTTLVNVFGPNRRAGIKAETFVGHTSFLLTEKFKDEYELFDFGIGSMTVYLDLQPA